MPLLDVAERPAMTTQSGGSDLITDPSIFASNASRYDSSPHLFDVGNSSIPALFEQSMDQRVHEDGLDRARYDSGFHSAEDLTINDPNPIRQRVSPMVALQAFPVNSATKGQAGWAKKKRLTALDQFGAASPVQRSDDFTLVEFNGRKYESGFVTLGVAWKMNYQDYMQQSVSALNFDEQTEKRKLCRLALRQAAERIAFMGDTSRQILGVANNQFIPRYTSPIRFEAGEDPGRIQQVIAEATSLSYTKTLGAARRPNAWLGSLTRNDFLRKQEYTTTRETARKTLNASLVGTGIQPGAVIDAPYLSDIDGTGHSVLLYRRDSECVSWDYPISVQFLPVFRPHGGWDVIQYAIARVGSVWFRYPNDTIYMTNV